MLLHLWQYRISHSNKIRFISAKVRKLNISSIIFFSYYFRFIAMRSNEGCTYLHPSMLAVMVVTHKILWQKATAADDLPIFVFLRLASFICQHNIIVNRQMFFLYRDIHINRSFTGTQNRWIYLKDIKKESFFSLQVVVDNYLLFAISMWSPVLFN